MADRHGSRRLWRGAAGVAVEASSPALIEKTRSALTDGSGQYRIIDLRPGTYVLTFTLAGFALVTRENVEVAGTQTVTIPIEMRVGGIEESITVAGTDLEFDHEKDRSGNQYCVDPASDTRDDELEKDRSFDA